MQQTDNRCLQLFSGFYTGWLLPAAIVGLLVFLYGVATMDMNQIALEVCNEGNQYEVSFATWAGGHYYDFWRFRPDFKATTLYCGGTRSHDPYLQSPRWQALMKPPPGLFRLIFAFWW
jgi:hypothetical protein